MTNPRSEHTPSQDKFFHFQILLYPGRGRFLLNRNPGEQGVGCLGKIRTPSIPPFAAQRIRHPDIED